MEEDEQIEIDSARAVTSAELMGAYDKNGYAKNGHSSSGSSYDPPSRRTVKVFTTIVALLVVTPFVFTFIGAITGPPHAGHIPEGHLFYLTGDEPSEHTTTLRGLFMVNSAGASSLIAHDTEPQDTDGGSRSWIDEPEVSPDGKSIAYLQDEIVLQDEVQSISQQLWMGPIIPGQTDTTKFTNQAKFIDLTPLGFKRIVGITWDANGEAVRFLNDNHLVQVSPANMSAAQDNAQSSTQTSKPALTQIAINGLPDLKLDKYMSSLSYPTLAGAGSMFFIAKTAQGSELVGPAKPLNGPSQTSAPPLTVLAQDVSGYGLSPDGTQAALVPDGRSHDIRIIDTATGQTRQVVAAKWGWSIFGGRQITSVGFSPDAKYLIYTVSKPPVPEEEMFLLDLSTGDVHLLPYRSGRASWTWAR